VQALWEFRCRFGEKRSVGKYAQFLINRIYGKDVVEYIRLQNEDLPSDEEQPISNVSP
jgi:hypothetical protein